MATLFDPPKAASPPPPAQQPTISAAQVDANAATADMLQADATGGQQSTVLTNGLATPNATNPQVQKASLLSGLSGSTT